VWGGLYTPGWMQRTAAIFLVLLVALPVLPGCGSSPRKDFDQGVTVHFILFREQAPKENVTLKPVFTVGDSVTHAPEVVFGPDEALAIGTARVKAPRGKKTRISFWDPRTRTGSRDTFDFEHELWVLVDIGELGPGKPARMIAYDYPPNEILQEWVPLVQIPD